MEKGLVVLVLMLIQHGNCFCFKMIFCLIFLFYKISLADVIGSLPVGRDVDCNDNCRWIIMVYIYVYL